MSTYFIDVADVVFFKDGRAIAPGSEYSASSIFPPNPVTVYGALRSAILAADPEADFKADGFGAVSERTRELAGTIRRSGETIFEVSSGSLQITDFGLARRINGKAEALYPLPGDVLASKKAEKGKESAQQAKAVDFADLGIRTNLPKAAQKHSWVRYQEGSFFEYQPIYLNETLWQQYLLGKTGHDSHLAELLKIETKRNEYTPDNFFRKEPRMGIVIDASSGTVEEGKLFTTPFIRLNPKTNVGFRLSIKQNIADTLDGALLRLGGDGKLSALTATETTDETGFTTDLKSAVKDTGMLKLVLLTPAVFGQGWLPDGFDAESGEGSLNGFRVRLTAANTGRYQPIGGWDVAKNCPKPTRRAVPAGAVYWIECEKGQEAALVDALHGTSICSNKEYQKQGLGIIHTGVA
ncbi:MAG: type III-B CRISPR module-associated protein Cmr3 [Balneolales bacterium]|nr:type III-B CRISPR module-associated protein Cmr3 [Balneolales bacterium]